MNNRPIINDIPIHVKENMIKVFKVSSKNTVKSWSKIWVDNLKENIKLCDFSKYSVYSLKDKFRGETAYLVGASPSLSKNVKELKKKKGIIITCSHALKYLIKNGIKPDYVVVLDAHEKQVDFLDIGDESKDIKLLADIMVHPNIFKVWNGRVWFFRTIGEKPKDKIHNALWKLSKFNDLIYTGGNVMSGAYSIADLLGCKRVVYVGMDFSNSILSDSFVEYADGSRDEGTFEHLDSFIHPDVNGLGVWTKQRMFMYKYWFDWMSLKTDRIEHINATEGGILGAYDEGNLKSIKQMKLKDVKNIKLKPEKRGLHAINKSVLKSIMPFLKETKKAVEIGSFYGDSTITLSNVFGKVYAIDPFEEDYDKYDVNSKVDMKKVEERFKKNTQGINNIYHIKNKSEKAVREFKNNSLDFVFIDSRHQYDTVKDNINKWLPKLKKQGVMAGDDYYVWSGVKKAVDEFVKKGNLKLNTSYNTWFIQLGGS
jgi:hypothetical protein